MQAIEIDPPASRVISSRRRDELKEASRFFTANLTYNSILNSNFLELLKIYYCKLLLLYRELELLLTFIYRYFPSSWLYFKLISYLFTSGKDDDPGKCLGERRVLDEHAVVDRPWKMRSSSPREQKEPWSWPRLGVTLNSAILTTGLICCPKVFPK